jgi:hypothetical protein
MSGGYPADGDRHLGDRRDPVRRARGRAFAEIIEQDAVRPMSAPSALEAAIVVESEVGDPGAREPDLLLY